MSQARASKLFHILSAVMCFRPSSNARWSPIMVTLPQMAAWFRTPTLNQILWAQTVLCQDLAEDLFADANATEATDATERHRRHPIMVTLPKLAAWFRTPTSAQVHGLSVFPADRDIGDREMPDCVSMASTVASRIRTEPGRLSRHSRTQGITYVAQFSLGT